MTDQGEENLDSSQKQKLGKSHSRIRRLKKENKFLKRRVKKIKVLKQKVVKIKEIIKELRKQLEKADNTHEIKKTKRHRAQGRNPLLRRAVQTSSVGTKTKLHILEEMVEMELHTETTTTEGVVVQNEEEIPLGSYEIEDQP